MVYQSWSTGWNKKQLNRDSIWQHITPWAEALPVIIWRTANSSLNNFAVYYSLNNCNTIIKTWINTPKTLSIAESHGLEVVLVRPNRFVQLEWLTWGGTAGGCHTGGGEVSQCGVQLGDQSIELCLELVFLRLFGTLKRFFVDIW